MASEIAPPATSAGFDSVPKNDIIPIINPSAPTTAKTKLIILLISSTLIIIQSLSFSLIKQIHVPTVYREKNSFNEPVSCQYLSNKILYTSVLYCTVRKSKLPKAGFKSITVAETVYDKFQDVYQKNKDNLAMKGVNSFSGYVTYMLEEMMQKDKTFARYAPKIEKISVDDDRVILKDNIKNRIAEVAVQKGELFCQLCEEKNCVHIGFVFSLPDVYEILNSRGIKHPK